MVTTSAAMVCEGTSSAASISADRSTADTAPPGWRRSRLKMRTWSSSVMVRLKTVVMVVS